MRFQRFCDRAAARWHPGDLPVDNIEIIRHLKWDRPVSPGRESSGGGEDRGKTQICENFLFKSALAAALVLIL